MHWYRPAAFENDYWFEGIGQEWSTSDIPAWSLHRLIEMIGDPFEMQHLLGFNIETDYDNIVECIEWLIEDNRFNKEYLVDLTGTDAHQDMVDSFRYAFEVLRKED